MNGALTIERSNRKVRTMMWLRGKESDASTFKPGWQSFSESVVPLIGGANPQARHLAQVARPSSHQWSALRPNAGALTNRSFGRFASLRAQQLSR